ncbi:hypothetical protein LX97_00089 [Nonlabens dokdonensis]|uniref:HTH luxR-type domain-containing protein n=2 Tax=Nonlabens dokdonensis TaxID=328515 RepID=A0ABX5PZE0_9FLAO|nr:periplasmic ligand-binding sensor [Nonlabens dokdonensis]AGC75391.1 putative periplasmic ligand-binding sensor [Nonlabens dokdonensis DSW-6]PZX43090.1 hypothetical protein LX97_00089 [Nonlabens dokdonensis]
MKTPILFILLFFSYIGFSQDCERFTKQIELDYKNNKLTLKTLDSIINVCNNIEKYPELTYYRGMLAFDQENFSLGIYELKRVLPFISDYNFKYSATTNLGILYAIQQDFENAKTTFQKSYDLAKVNNDEENMDYSMESLLALALDSGDISYLSKYETFFSNKDFNNDFCAQLHSLSFLAEFCYQFGKFEKAEEIIKNNFISNTDYSGCELELATFNVLRSKLALENKKYKKGIQILDSISFSKIEVIDRVPAYKLYKKLYNGLDDKVNALRYSDSITNILELNKINIDKSNKTTLNVLKEKEGDYKSKIYSLSGYILGFILLILVLIYIVYYVNKSRKAIKEKSKIYKDNYNKLWGNYQLTNQKLELLKKELINQKIDGNKNFYNNLINEINIHIDSSSEDPHKHLNMVEDAFVNDLKKVAPYLTDKEVQICFFFKLGLSHKKIAEILNKTEKSIDSYKYRINKKVRENQQIELNELLQKFD